MTAPRFEPRNWERNGTGLTLTHTPNRKSVALLAVLGPPQARTTTVLAWLADIDADILAGILDRMLDDPPATYGDGGYGDRS